MTAVHGWDRRFHPSLVGTEGRSDAEMCRVSDQVRAAFASQFQVTERQGKHTPCLYHLLGRRCPGAWKCLGGYEIPGWDHGSEWMQDGRTYCLVSQPYDFGWQKMVATVEFCQKFGVQADVMACYSWHFPGWTTLIMYRRQKEPVPA